MFRGPWSGKYAAARHSSYGRTEIAKEKTLAMKSSGCARLVGAVIVSHVTGGGGGRHFLRVELDQPTREALMQRALGRPSSKLESREIAMIE